MRRYQIRDTIPPKSWEESIPIGCGRMGTTLLAGVMEEELRLNEETIWSGTEGIKPNPNMAEKMARIRELFLDGKPAEADRLAKTEFADCFNRIRSYEGAGIVKIGLHENTRCKNYSHKLDLINAIATVEYDKDGSHYTREAFASYPDQVIAYKVTSSKADLIARISYERERILSLSADGNEICATAKTIFGDRRFCVKLRVVTDGTVSIDDNDLCVTDTKSFCVYISIASAFSHEDAYVEKTAFPETLDYADLKARHIADFSAVMCRADISIPQIDEVEDVPMTDRQWILRCDKVKDGGLIMLQWQFGRYLLASSSRPGTLPANLQGLWTRGDVSEWNCDYHTNINLQANYWAAETVNLSDCHQPLFDYMNRFLLESGKETAAIGYKTRGCVVHHLSDIYGFTSVADGLWGAWPHGASWLSLHMWEHFLFTQDETFLRNEAYEFIRQSALFFLDNLVEDKQGRLLYGPSHSPENSYYVTDENGEKYKCYLALSTTMDVEIIYTLFDIFIKSSSYLGIDDADVEATKIAIEKLPKLQIGKEGQLLEWMEEYDEVNPDHYHVSHSFGLFPGSMINRSTPDTYRAIGKTIDRRSIDRGNAASASNVGWSLAWSGAGLARLRRGEDAYERVLKFVRDRVKPNLWDVIPLAVTGDCFQIDGDLGIVATISEMLIQSHEDVIALLPAIPAHWDRGSFHGLRARGGFELNIAWESSSVHDIVITSYAVSDCVLELPVTQRQFSFRDESGKIYTAVDGRLFLNVSGSLHLTAL